MGALSVPELQGTFSSTCLVFICWLIKLSLSIQDTLPIKSVIRPAKDLKALAVPTNFTDSFVDDPGAFLIVLLAPTFADMNEVIVRHPMKIYNHFGSDGATGQSQTFVLPEGKLVLFFFISFCSSSILALIRFSFFLLQGEDTPHQGPQVTEP
jgi:hypothetical protein